MAIPKSDWDNGFDAGAAEREAELRKQSPCGVAGHLNAEFKESFELCGNCGYELRQHQNYVANKKQPSSCASYRTGKMVDGFCLACARERELREALHSSIDALKEFADWHGGAHTKGCPADDTCGCRGKPVNDKVNSSIESGDALLAVETKQPETPKEWLAAKYFGA